MFRPSLSKIMISLLSFVILLAACTPAPGTEPATEPAYPAPTQIPQEYPPPTDSPASPAPVEPTSVSSPFAGLPVITAGNAANLSTLDSVPTFQDAHIIGSPDGTKFAAYHSGNDPDILLFPLDASSLKPLQLTHPQAVMSAAFSPDGVQIASTSQDGTLRIWETSTGTQTSSLDVAPFFQNLPYADTVEFSPDGKRIALFVNADSALYLFNVPFDNTLPTILAWTEHASPIVSVYPSPDWQTFAWVGRGTLVLMNADGSFRGEQINHEDFITNILYSQDSQRLFIQTAQTANNAYVGVVIVYDVQTGQALQTLVHPEFVTTSTLSPDGAILAASSGNTVKLWDWATGTEKLTIPDLPDVAQSLSFSPDGQLLTGTFNLGVIQVWDISTGQAIASYQPGGELSGARFMMEGTVLVSTQYDGTVHLLGVVP